MKTFFKWVLRILVTLFFLGVLLAVVAVLLKDVIAKSLAEKNLRDNTGMDAKIERMEVGLATPTVNLEGLKIYNTVDFGGGTLIAPEAEVDDGLLDVVLIPKRPAPELAMAMAQIALGAHLSSKTIVFRRAAKLTVNSKPGMWFNVDGELVGNEPARFEIVPRALRFIAPKT